MQQLQLIDAIRDARRLTSTEKLVLLVLASHVDRVGKCYPSQDKLAAETSMTVRTIRATIRSLQTPTDDGRPSLIDVVPGHHHTPTHYTVRADLIASLREDRIAAQRPETGSLKGGNERSSERKQDPPKDPREGSHEGAQGESASASALTIEEGFAIAEEVAESAGHPQPGRGEKNTKAMATLIGDAEKVAKGRRGMTAAEALRDRLIRHHERDDSFLAEHRYPLSCATQVDAMPPTKPECHKVWVEPRVEGPRMTTAETLAAVNALVASLPNGSAA